MTIAHKARTKELSHRIEARRRELESRIAGLKAEGTKASTDAARSVRAKLHEMDTLVRNGWDDLSDKALARLNELLDQDDDDATKKQG